uniref:G-protein coupled receptors family 1 profile domain-containing protein n=1 Tax=Xenopus tropicalis TaxID=8364 RepID=A0A1B8YAP8_XENTR
METENITIVKEFILLGLSTNPTIRILYFLLILPMYFMMLFGNIVFIYTITQTPKIHTPMYFFLCVLSFLDVCVSSSTFPKMFVDTFLQEGRISVLGCMTQMGTIIVLASYECNLLTVMAFDRYIAICYPLHYMTIMTWRVCKTVTGILFVFCFLSVFLPTIIKPMTFCIENKLDHFAYLICHLVKLSFYCCVLYLHCIIISLLKISSTVGRTKAFCLPSNSHLTVVSLFYGTIITMYLGVGNNFPPGVSLVYGVVTPMLNPFIYSLSLRNNEVKEAVKKNIYPQRIKNP